MENDNGTKPPTDRVNWDEVRRYIAEHPPLPAELQPDEWDEVPPGAREEAEETASAQASQFRKLALILGSEATEAIRVNRERAARVERTWWGLILLREKKRRQLEHVLDEMGALEDSWPAWHQRRIEDVKLIADEVSSIDADIAAAFENNQRGSTILREYEYGGAGMERPTQWKGFARKRLSRRIMEAYRATLPIVTAVFGEKNAQVLRDRRNSDVEVALELHRRLGGAQVGELTLNCCVLAIAIVRRHIGLGPSSDSDASAEVLKHLRDARFIEEWLKPRAGDDGRGTGPKRACVELLANATDLGFACVRDLVDAATRATRPPVKRTPRVRRNVYRFKPLRLLTE